MELPNNTQLKKQAEWIVSNLDACRKRMLGLADDGALGEDGIGGGGGKEFKSRLAGCAFDLARETKELVRTVEEIDLEGRRADLS
jgi:hypothetical protein